MTGLRQTQRMGREAGSWGDYSRGAEQPSTERRASGGRDAARGRLRPNGGPP